MSVKLEPIVVDQCPAVLHLDWASVGLLIDGRESPMFGVICIPTPVDDAERRRQSVDAEGPARVRSARPRNVAFGPWQPVVFLGDDLTADLLQTRRRSGPRNRRSPRWVHAFVARGAVPVEHVTFRLGLASVSVQTDGVEVIAQVFLLICRRHFAMQHRLRANRNVLGSLLREMTVIRYIRRKNVKLYLNALIARFSLLTVT